MHSSLVASRERTVLCALHTDRSQFRLTKVNQQKKKRSTDLAKLISFVASRPRQSEKNRAHSDSTQLRYWSLASEVSFIFFLFSHVNHFRVNFERAKLWWASKLDAVAFQKDEEKYKHLRHVSTKPNLIVDEVSEQESGRWAKARDRDSKASIFTNLFTWNEMETYILSKNLLIVVSVTAKPVALFLVYLRRACSCVYALRSRCRLRRHQRKAVIMTLLPFLSHSSHTYRSTVSAYVFTLHTGWPTPFIPFTHLFICFVSFFVQMFSFFSRGGFVCCVCIASTVAAALTACNWMLSISREISVDLVSRLGAESRPSHTKLKTSILSHKWTFLSAACAPATTSNI